MSREENRKNRIKAFKKTMKGEVVIGDSDEDDALRELIEASKQDQILLAKTCHQQEQSEMTKLALHQVEHGNAERKAKAQEYLDSLFDTALAKCSSSSAGVNN